jgi:hypothetical protein
MTLFVLRPLLVVVLVLASVGAATAECAWVLWMNDVGERTPNAAPVDSFVSKDEADA